MRAIEQNWAGNYTFSARSVHRPTSLDELRRIVAHAPKIHAIGTAHSFNDIADASEIVALDHLDIPIEIDHSQLAVTVGAGVTYGALARELEREGLALHNMASLPHISVGGAIATGTHGSGDRLGNLATAVKAIELVTSEGELLNVTRGDDDFDGMVVHLGALGVVTRLTIDIQPSYMMQQVVYEHLPWDVFFDQFDNVMSSADSVSLFTNFGDDIAEMWQKTRVDATPQTPLPDERFGARLATKTLHPVPSLPAENCTDQLGIPGCWADRLPHFRMDSFPASGNEIQSEYMVDRKNAVLAIQAILEIAPSIRPYLLTSEIRSLAADDLWMSTAYHRATIGIHFSWKYDPIAIERLLPLVETALEPFAPRTHWGKVFNATSQTLGARYEKMADFRLLMKHMDPRGAFRNAFLDRHLIG